MSRSGYGFSDRPAIDQSSPYLSSQLAKQAAWDAERLDAQRDIEEGRKRLQEMYRNSSPAQKYAP